MALRLTAFVSGKVQVAGYRSIVIDMANAFSLKGRVENRNDGRVKIIAEGEDEKIKWFEQAIDIKNASIMDQMNENLSGNMDQMLGKQDCLLDEVRDVNLKLDRVTEMDIIELKSDMAEVKAALRAKGII